MPVYAYKTRDPDGKSTVGELSAANEHEALTALTLHGSVIVRLTQIKKNKKPTLFQIFNQINLECVLTFFSQFSFLIRSGMPLYKSLEMVIGQTNDENLKKVLNQIRLDLSNGASLSHAMQRHGDVFNDMHISMIVVGENAGKLDQSFDRIIEMIEGKRNLQQKLNKIFHYIIAMLSIAVVVMTGVLIFVFPKFAVIFTKVGMDLPLTTRIMIELSDFMLLHSVAIPFSIFLVVGGVWAYFRTQQGKVVRDQLKFKIPVVKTIAINAELANFTRTLSSLLSTGVPVLDALNIYRDSTNDQVLKPIFTTVINDVREGSTISSAFQKHALFPVVMTQLTAAGENSGELDVMMGNIHEYFKQRVEESISRFSAVLEPAMLVILGGMVLVMAMSIFLPMFNLASAIRK